jgi:chromosome segregation ATPase
VPTYWWTLLLLELEFAAQVEMQPSRPSEFWPVSITGWITLASSTLALIVVLWRANNKPILDVLQRLEVKVDEEIKRIEERLDETASDRKDGEAKILKQIDGRLDGFSGRVDENKQGITFLHSKYESVNERMVRSEADRQQMNIRIAETRAETESLRKAIPDMELRFTNALNAQSSTLLKAQSEILREIPKMIQDALVAHVAAHPTHQHPQNRR